MIYIGDSNTDILTGRNAGFDTAGVLWGFREKEELVEVGATYITESPQDIVKIITGH
jgi:phosphoglycolate phosphatase